MTVERAYGVLEKIIDKCKEIERDLEDARSQVNQILGRAESLAASDLSSEPDWDDLHGHGLDKTLYDIELAERAVDQLSGYCTSAYRMVPQ